MKIEVVNPAAAAVVPVADPLPLVEAAIVRNDWGQWKGTLDSILFFGLLAIGILAPFVGATYALIFR